MHKRLSPRPSSGVASRRDAGIALVIILFCITLLAMMVLAFVSGARTELASSTQYSTGAQAQQLAASALNVAMGQLAEATDLKWAPDPTTVAWASQPGMIRTYDDHGNPLKFYKLYSSDEMIFDGSSISTKTDLATYLDKERPGTWNTKPAIFTDLNEPSVRMVNGTAALYFPIADPRAAAALIPNIKINNVVQAVVPGFSFTTTAGTQALGGAKKPSNVNDATARLPMPVKWLYVLKDGSTKAATSTDGLTATVPGASKANPIVGRIAFWMDDDCNKVNINTAAEGSYWDVPVAAYQWEFANLDSHWPVQGEFQRFPGHPATTSLSAVFPTLKSQYTAPSQVAPSQSNQNPYAIQMAPQEVSTKFYNMTPRIRGGNPGEPGSHEGTVNTSAAGQTGIPLSGDRLYDSVDELLYTVYNPGTGQPDRSQRSFLSASDLSLRRFFLTAHSRAPETNLFNQPRIAIWPFDADSSKHRNAVEGLMAQASTAGQEAGPNASSDAKEFYFTRYTPDGALSPTIDFLDEHPTAPRAAGRNVQLYRYLQDLTSRDIPGFGGNFQAKWGTAERDQILTEIFDYIRAGLNLRTDLNPAKEGYTWDNPAYNPNTNPWATQGYRAVVYPTVPPTGGPGAGTRGFGRYVTLSEVGLHIGSMYAGPETHKDANGQPTNLNPAGSVPPAFPLAPGKTGPPYPVDATGRFTLTSRTLANGDYVCETDIWPSTLIELFLPSPGMKTGDVDVAVRVDGLSTFRWSAATAIQTDINGNVVIVPNSTSARMWPVDTKTFYFIEDGDRIARLMNSRIPAFELYYQAPLPPQIQFGKTSRTGRIFPWTNPQGTVIVNYGAVPKEKFTAPGGFPGPPGPPGPAAADNIYGWDPWDWSETSYAKAMDAYAVANGVPQGFTVEQGTLTIVLTPAEVESSGPMDPSWAQHFSITFPGFTMHKNPVPKCTNWGGFAYNSDKSPMYYPWWDISQRCAPGGGGAGVQTGQAMLTGPNPVSNVPMIHHHSDIYRSMVLRSSDNRLLAVRGNSISNGTWENTNDFVPHYLYNNTAHPDEFLAHSFSAGPANFYTGVDAFTSPLYPPAPFSDVNGGTPNIYGYPQLGSLVSDGIVNGRVVNPLMVPGGDWTQTYSKGDAKDFTPRVRYWPVAKTPGDTELPYGSYFGTTAAMEGNFAGRAGDWDTGPGSLLDGSYINKPDEGFDTNVDTNGNVYPYSYLNGYMQASESAKPIPTFYSPSRQIASAVMFGSLPTGGARNLPWQTLLFCPNPAAGWANSLTGQLDKIEHPGYGVPAFGPPFTTPPDYLLLDLFWMPVTEPWAISDSFSTAGKINMNYRMFPFDYITRTTGMRAVFANTYITAIMDAMIGHAYDPNFFWSAYKGSFGAGMTGINGSDPNKGFIRYPINPEETLKQFDEKFNGTGPGGLGPDIFRSAAQICEEFLVPGQTPDGQPATLPTLTTTRAASGGFWADKRLTGDNLRERPYNSLYPRLTTRSNVYTVHVRAQAIQQTASTLNSAPDTFTEGKDKMNGEYRVSYEIERYLDPNLTTYTDRTALGPYKLRVINQRTVDW